MLVHVRSISVHQRGQCRKIFPRMEARLSADLDAGTIEEWNSVDEGDVEAELASDGRFLAKPVRLLLRVAIQRRELVAREPLPMAVDRFVFDNRVDLGNRRETGVPHRLCM